MIYQQSFTGKYIVTKAAWKVEPFDIPMNLADVSYALAISRKRFLTKFALEETCCLTVVIYNYVCSKYLGRLEAFFANFTLDVLLWYTIVAF